MSVFSTALLMAPPGNDRPVVASDVEGTLFGGRAWQGMRDYLLAHGREAQYKRFVRRNTWQILKYRLKLTDDEAFKVNWMLGLLSLFEGLGEADLAAAGHFIVAQELWPQRRQAVLDELMRYRDSGHRVILVSGMFEPFLAAVLAKLPGVEGIGTPLSFVDGRFTGQLRTDFHRGLAKSASLAPFQREGRIEAAFGDTAADIPMLSLANRPVAVAPDQKLAQHAAAQDWQILAP
ncbi:MAG: haloacid dehalogenase-like hydrolase [Anaerolineales bacterium]|nr:haloacid dehalogenase-like hydrolase [Anaerolineales bacterium]